MRIQSSVGLTQLRVLLAELVQSRYREEARLEPGITNYSGYPLEPALDRDRGRV